MKAYEEDKAQREKDGGTVDLSTHSCMPSVLRHMPHMAKVVQLQQALQQAFCMHGVQTQAVVMSEPNSLQYTPGATAMQTHGLKTIFNMMTEIHEARPALLPRRQLMAQIFAAMVKTALKPQDLLEMRANTHAEEIAAFTDVVMSCAQMDQVASAVCYVHLIRM